MEPLMQALPLMPPQPSRGRRRNRRQRAPAANMGAAGSGRIIVTDSELIDIPETLLTLPLNPASDSLLRLSRYETMYERFRYIKLVVTFEPTSGMATEGSVAFSLLTGPAQAVVKDRATILKCQPARVTPAWKRATIVAGVNLDSQRFLHCGEAGDGGVAATIYCLATAKSLGFLRVSYTVEFAFPRPF